jgi:hypothetical protein
MAKKMMRIEEGADDKNSQRSRTSKINHNNHGQNKYLNNEGTNKHRDDVSAHASKSQMSKHSLDRPKGPPLRESCKIKKSSLINRDRWRWKCEGISCAFQLGHRGDVDQARDFEARGIHEDDHHEGRRLLDSIHIEGFRKTQILAISIAVPVEFSCSHPKPQTE